MKPYPLLLRPMLLPKVWGGDRLARFGKAVKPGDRVGESWEVADLDATSASGAGGGAARSIIENGPLAGQTIRDATRAFGVEAMFGTAPRCSASNEVPPPFPLLVKFLDARENLSVQVHPSIAYAKAHRGASIKTECWYILDAEPGSVIYKGLREGVTREVFERHLRGGPDGDGSGVVGDLEAVPAVVGEMHNLPSGTVHALGAGVVVAEVQTPSDTTFRVYDWGRSGRELHIDAALECIMWGPARGATKGTRAEAASVQVSRLVSTGFYVVDEIRSGVGERGSIGSDGGAEVVVSPGEAGEAGRTAVVMCVSGGCVVGRDVTGAEAVPLQIGQTAIVPAGCVPAARVRMDPGSVVLRAMVMG